MTAPLLVTGFEAFDGSPANPTGEVVRDWRRTGRWSPSRVELMVLPVTYDGAAMVARARMRAVGACGWLGFGVARTATSMLVETRAYNVASSPTVDNAGAVRSGERLSADPTESIDSAVGEQLVTILAAQGVAAARSEDPGRFVCNATMFRMLASARDAAFRAAFVHVPPTSDAQSLDALSSAMCTAVDAMLNLQR